MGNHGGLYRFALMVLAALFASAAAAGAATYKPRYASIIVDAGTGRVLHEANADLQAYPASLTKMMTLYILFEAIDSGAVTMRTPMKVSKRAAGQAPSRLGLAPGSTIRVEDAIEALITRSANDVATVVAEHLGGTETNFAVMMTAKARAMGMGRTTFRNASGLPNQSQLSTARDMAVLAKRLMTDFPQHYPLFSRMEFRYAGKVYRTHNNLLKSYDGADGIKTGFTNASGFNLVASAARGGRRLIGVVFGGTSAGARDKHLAELLDAGFAVMDGKPELVMAAPRIAAFDGPIMASASAGDTDGPSMSSLLGIRSASAREIADLPDDARFGVQIGAFSTEDRADTVAVDAAMKVQDTYGDAMPRVEPVVIKGRKLYRAQVVGLPERELIRACSMIGVKTKSGCQKIGPVAN